MHQQDRFGGSGGHGRRFIEPEVIAKADRKHGDRQLRNAAIGATVGTVAGHEGVLARTAENLHGIARQQGYDIKRSDAYKVALKEGHKPSALPELYQRGLGNKRILATGAGIGALVGVAATKRKPKKPAPQKELASKGLANTLRRAVGRPTVAPMPKKAATKLPPLDWDGPKARPARKVGPYEHVSPYDRPRDAAARANAARRPAASAGPSRSDLRAQDKIAWHNSNLDREPRGIYKADVRKAARYYDPEHRRQRRLGMAEVGLLGGGLAATGLGVRGVRNTSRLVRGSHPNMVGSAKELEALKGKLKRTVSAKPTDVALLGGGAAGIGGAAAVRQKAEGRKFGIWR